MSHGLALDHAAWSSPWRGRSVRDKGVLSLGLLLAAVALPPVPGGIAVAVVSAAILLGPVRVGWSRLWRILWLPLLSILVGVAAIAIRVGWDGGMRLGTSAAGIETAGQVAIRSVAATLAMFTLACSTPMVDLLSGLRRARVPDAIVEVASLIYRIIFGLLESAGAIRQAQEARLGYVNRRAAMRSASLGTVMLFVRTWDHARRLDEGLTGRGYVDSLRTLEPPRRRSAAFLAGAVAVLAVIVAGSIAWAVWA